MISDKIVRPATSTKHRPSKRPEPTNLWTHRYDPPSVTLDTAVSGVSDCRRMDRFLSRHQQSTKKTQQFSHPSRQIRETFRTQSAVLPCDWTGTNHFGREGRGDLRDSQFDTDKRIHTEPQNIDQQIARYTSEACTPQTHNYFENIIRKRMSQERKKQSTDSIKRQAKLRSCYKSGVTGYRFAQADDFKLQDRRLRKCNYRESAWHSTIFNPVPPKEPQTTAKPQHVFRNILSQNPQVRSNKLRQANLRRNDCRRDYNFITMERC